MAELTEEEKKQFIEMIKAKMDEALKVILKDMEALKS